MLYKELYKESNELAKERFVLVRERVAEIEEKPETEEKYKEYFRQTAQLLQNRRLSMIYGQMMRFKNRV